MAVSASGPQALDLLLSHWTVASFAIQVHRSTVFAKFLFRGVVHDECFIVGVLTCTNLLEAMVAVLVIADLVCEAVVIKRHFVGCRAGIVVELVPTITVG